MEDMKSMATADVTKSLLFAALFMMASFAPLAESAVRVARDETAASQTPPEEYPYNNNKSHGLAEAEGSGEAAEGEGKPSGSGSPFGLGYILGILFLVCCILYCIGIGYKIFKICKGTYVEEEPVFLKYK